MKPTLLRRVAVRAASGWRVMSSPAMLTRPESGVSRSPATCSSVDLPAPEGATSATTSPGATASVAPCSTVTSPRLPLL